MELVIDFNGDAKINLQYFQEINGIVEFKNKDIHASGNVAVPMYEGELLYPGQSHYNWDCTILDKEKDNEFYTIVHVIKNNKRIYLTDYFEVEPHNWSNHQ